MFMSALHMRFAAAGPGEKVRVMLDLVERYDRDTRTSSTAIGGRL